MVRVDAGKGKLIPDPQHPVAVVHIVNAVHGDGVHRIAPVGGDGDGQVIALLHRGFAVRRNGAVGAGGGGDDVGVLHYGGLHFFALHIELEGVVGPVGNPLGTVPSQSNGVVLHLRLIQFVVGGDIGRDVADLDFAGVVVLIYLRDISSALERKSAFVVLRIGGADHVVFEQLLDDIRGNVAGLEFGLRLFRLTLNLEHRHGFSCVEFPLIGIVVPDQGHCDLCIGALGNLMAAGGTGIGVIIQSHIRSAVNGHLAEIRVIRSTGSLNLVSNQAGACQLIGFIRVNALHALYGDVKRLFQFRILGGGIFLNLVRAGHVEGDGVVFCNPLPLVNIPGQDDLLSSDRAMSRCSFVEQGNIFVAVHRNSGFAVGLVHVAGVAVLDQLIGLRHMAGAGVADHFHIDQVFQILILDLVRHSGNLLLFAGDFDNGPVGGVIRQSFCHPLLILGIPSQVHLIFLSGVGRLVGNGTGVLDILLPIGFRVECHDTGPVAVHTEDRSSYGIADNSIIVVVVFPQVIGLFVQVVRFLCVAALYQNGVVRIQDAGDVSVSGLFRHAGHVKFCPILRARFRRSPSPLTVRLVILSGQRDCDSSLVRRSQPVGGLGICVVLLHIHTGQNGHIAGPGAAVLHHITYFIAVLTVVIRPQIVGLVVEITVVHIIDAVHQNGVIFTQDVGDGAFVGGVGFVAALAVIFVNNGLLGIGLFTRRDVFVFSNIIIYLNISLIGNRSCLVGNRELFVNIELSYTIRRNVSTNIVSVLSKPILSNQLCTLVSHCKAGIRLADHCQLVQQGDRRIISADLDRSVVLGVGNRNSFRDKKIIWGGCNQFFFKLRNVVVDAVQVQHNTRRLNSPASDTEFYGSIPAFIQKPGDARNHSVSRRVSVGVEQSCSCSYCFRGGPTPANPTSICVHIRLNCNVCLLREPQGKSDPVIAAPIVS